MPRSRFSSSVASTASLALVGDAMTNLNSFSRQVSPSAASSRRQGGRMWQDTHESIKKRGGTRWKIWKIAIGAVLRRWLRQPMAQGFAKRGERKSSTDRRLVLNALMSRASRASQFSHQHNLVVLIAMQWRSLVVWRCDTP